MHRILLALGLVASCTAAPEPTVEPPAPSPAAEPRSTATQLTAGQLYGVMPSREGLTLQIASGGCRQNSDVAFAVDEGALVITDVTIDGCEAYIPLGAKLLFAWNDLPSFSKLSITTDPAPVEQPATTPGPSQAPAGAKDESIYGVLVGRDGLDVRVGSGGCTKAEDFASWVEPEGDGQLVHLARTKPDMCDAHVPEGVLLHFTWKQLGVTKQSVRLANSIVALGPK